MGWNRGSGLFDEVIEAVNDAELTDEQKKIVYERLIEAFENLDCDTLQECLGEDEVFDEVYNKLNPPEDDWDDEELEDE